MHGMQTLGVYLSIVNVAGISAQGHQGCLGAPATHSIELDYQQSRLKQEAKHLEKRLECKLQ